jgi:hypothetical protein
MIHLTGLVSSRQLSSRSAVYPDVQSHAAEDTEDSEKCKKIHFIRSQLKIGFCEEYRFGRRNIFGLFENNLEFPADTSSTNGGTTYTWPREHLHTKARDAYSKLGERFPVPDQKISWKIDWDKYTPTLANKQTNPDEVNAIKGENPCGR